MTSGGHFPLLLLAATKHNALLEQRRDNVIEAMSSLCSVTMLVATLSDDKEYKQYAPLETSS